MKTKNLFKGAAMFCGILTFGIGSGLDAAEFLGNLDEQIFALICSTLAFLIFGYIGYWDEIKKGE